MAISRAKKRHLEVAAVVCVYGVIFLYLIGPFIGSVSGFDSPAIDTADIGRPSLIHTLTTVRGWILIVTLAVVMFSYIYLRPRVTGHDPSTFWKDGE